MKKSLYISFLCAATLMSSCDLEAPTQSSITEETVFSTEALADAAVMGIHQSLVRPTHIVVASFHIMEPIPTARFSTTMPV